MSESVRTQHRVRASELEGRGWLNTGGKSLDLESLRGKIVLLDFWTFCCINCLHVLDELRPLEEKYSDVLVTVGVHSPKFEHEADPVALASAVERYEIHHPVLDDPELATWKAYTARAWPTLVVVDPEGYIVAHLSGEGHADGLAVLLEELVAEHEAKGTLHRGNGPYVAPVPTSGTLRFPGKATQLANGNYLVVDSGHHRLVELRPDLETVERVIGSGTKGYLDGQSEIAQFNEPQGVTLLPSELAWKLGYDAVVADTVNHRLRGVTLSSGYVQTIAGNGVQRLLDTGPARVTDSGAGTWSEHHDDGPADFAGDAVDVGALGVGTEVSLSSPWDVVWSEKLQKVVIAMAGTHQIFAYEPLANEVSILAGSGLEGLLDGKAEEAWFAQSSGVAIDGEDNIWVADSETSSLRRLVISDSGVTVETAVGKGLFDFGFRDGEASEARLQHPLGVTVLPDNSVAIADTYNGAVRRYDPATKSVSTLARGLAEPSDVVVVQVEGSDPLLVVVESNKHQLVLVPIPKEALQVDEGASQTQRPKSPVTPGTLELAVRFKAPTGQKLDDRWGDPTQMKISSTPPELLVSGGGTSVGLLRTLELSADVPEGILHITARAAACDGPETEDGEIPDHAACHLYQQDWGIPVVLQADGESELVLDLRGMD
ncbi:MULTISPECIES: NHL domain-containing thioredoxin family protein [Paenarthrobacter]|jgi:thiol-disulfide isomerase/thioredoxin|uniref:NHL domain-containing thioredoxin family protein n=1 Tax=Paenarthrobacter TaxID=1742992 RepID=UPI0023660870|nr:MULTISPECIES: NHL domain-containing thioredoxin family protein [Paenarthrobacter]MDD7837154.1 NHL domain-containing thioredoxin family protein [Paenarthrobacter sp. AB444]MDP9937851.1 thiol-disulfide isomerase/thioredoxin [Paenarthrobacter nicotinovorans]